MEDKKITQLLEDGKWYLSLKGTITIKEIMNAHTTAEKTNKQTKAKMLSICSSSGDFKYAIIIVQPYNN